MLQVGGEAVIVSENEFVSGIEYLINNNIILLRILFRVMTRFKVNMETSSAEMIPDWIKNNANWWSENLIGDTDFINGLQYLIEYKIIKIDNKKILGQVPLEDIKFSSSWQFDKNSLGFRRIIFL